MQNLPKFTLILCVLICLAGCDEKPFLLDFTSDGCSLFPDRSLIDARDWCECCVQHDIAYWQGGTELQRLAADEQLRACVLAKTDDELLAETMFNGVRMGGSPWFYNWYRWGYGWTDGRRYQGLTLEEQRMVSDKLVEHFKRAAPRPCA